MKKILLFLGLMAFSMPAGAQEVVIETLCHYVMPVVGDEAEYKPGTDVHGKPVAAADLNQQIKPILYPLEIPVEIDVIKLLGLDETIGLPEGAEIQPAVAYVKVYEGGKIEYNGVDISDRAFHVCNDKQESMVAPAVAGPPSPVLAAAPSEHATIEPAAGQEQVAAQEAPASLTPAVSEDAVIVPTDAELEIEQ